MNQNKIDSMEAVGELPDFGNLLLREGGFPHLPEPQKWNDAGTKPTIAGVYETRHAQYEGTMFQFFGRDGWGSVSKDITLAEHYYFVGEPSYFQDVEWREVQ